MFSFGKRSRAVGTMSKVLACQTIPGEKLFLASRKYLIKTSCTTSDYHGNTGEIRRPPSAAGVGQVVRGRDLM